MNGFGLKFIILTLLLASPILTFAQLEGNPENWCRNGFFPREEADFYIGEIKAKRGEQVRFFSDDGKCPNGKSCQRKAYLVNGDEVLVSRKFGNFSCVWYQSKKGGEVIGWIPTNKIEGLNFLSERFKPWLGEWRFYDNSLKITQGEKQDVFKVAGNAF